MNLIVPMAGKSSRFPNLRPKWMLTHPSGRFMAIEAIKSLNLEKFSKIYFVCLQEHEDQYSFIIGFNEELEDLGILTKSEFILLKESTCDQPETVKQAIKAANIKGSIFVKDSDNHFAINYNGGNHVCYFDLNDSGLIKPSNKSYLTKDKSGYISNIVEKNVISPFYCVGGYGFKNAELFVDTLDSFSKKHDRYISDIIYKQILDGENFEANKVEQYIDWGTLEDWNRFKRTYATLFVDIDGTLVKNSSSHFPPYIGNTDPITDNINIINKLFKSGKFQIILTTARPEKYRDVTLSQMEKEGIPFNKLIMGLYHSKRIIINDYSKSNPFKSCDSINLKRDSGELGEMLKESLGLDYEEI
tara:strand:+ start:8065 stop:9141 length:1077 start_codon:yes stop_codon:yes gene_type:complete